MRQLVSTAIVALIVGSLAGATAGTLAQSSANDTSRLAADVTMVADPAAGIDAATVNGIRATKATTTASKRANKLVAANALGYLPSNIVKPQWSLVTGVPAGFADGKDDGITGITITEVANTGPTFTSGFSGYATATCPTGTALVGGGFNTGSDVTVFNSHKTNHDPDVWMVEGLNRSVSATRSITAYAYCLNVSD